MLQEPLIVIQGDVHSTEDEDSYKLYIFKVHGAPEPEDEGFARHSAILTLWKYQRKMNFGVNANNTDLKNETNENKRMNSVSFWNKLNIDNSQTFDSWKVLFYTDPVSTQSISPVKCIEAYEAPLSTWKESLQFATKFNVSLL